MTRILHISKFYPPYIGGMEDAACSIVRVLAARGDVEQRVVCFNDRHRTVHGEHNGVPVTRAGNFMTFRSQPLSFSYRSLLRRAIRSFAPDVIHFHAPNPFVMWLVLGLIPDGTRLVVHWHSDIVAQRRLYPLVRSVERRFLGRADTIVATSPAYVEGSKPLRRFRDKVKVIPNMVDTAKLERTPAVESRIAAIKEQFPEPVVFFVGRHVPYKGLDCLMAAAGYVRSPCRILVGGAPTELTEKLRSGPCAANVHFLGRIPDADLAAWYYAADILAFPSVTRNEAFGMVLAEAMYCRTPAVTFTIPGSGVNWVCPNGETGLEAANGDARAFARAIDLLLEDDGLRERLADNARRRARREFTADNLSRSIYDLYLL